jgi:hypothetical protein
MTKDEVSKELDCSTRQVEKHASEGRLGQVEYVRGKRGRQASYSPEAVAVLKAELERERAEVIGHGAPSTALARRTPAQAAPVNVAALAVVLREALAVAVAGLDARPVWLTKAQAVEVSGLPARWIDRAVKAGRLKAIGRGHGWRVHRDEVLKLAESFRVNGEGVK